MNYQIIPFKKFSQNEWDALLEKFDATINYSFWFISYQEILNKNNSIKNLTFAISREEIVFALIPLYAEKINNKWQISSGQEPIFSPIFSLEAMKGDLNKYYEIIVTEIINQAERYKCILARFQYSPLLSETSHQKNYFANFDFKEEILYPDWYIYKSKQSYVVDLNDSKKELLNKIRARYKTYVNKTSKITELLVLDQFCFEKKLFKKYIDFYYEVKGPKRSIEAFKLDEFGIKNGFEIILLCKYKDRLIGAVAIHTFQKKARYNSSLRLYNIEKGIYPNHFLLKASIEYLKDNDFIQFEIGEQVSYSDLYSVSLKEENLSYFKSGWGGRLLPAIKIQKEFK